MDYGLAGRTIVVTGAARGQGAAEAGILVAEGARVIGADILDDEGTALAARLSAQGPGRLEYRHLDVSDEDQWQRLAADLAASGEIRSEPLPLVLVGHVEVPVLQAAGPLRGQPRGQGRALVVEDVRADDPRA